MINLDFTTLEKIAEPEEEASMPSFFEGFDYDPPEPPKQPKQPQEAQETASDEEASGFPMTLSSTKESLLKELCSGGSTERILRLALQAIALATDDPVFLHLARASNSPVSAAKALDQGKSQAQQLKQQELKDVQEIVNKRLTNESQQEPLEQRIS